MSALANTWIGEAFNLAKREQYLLNLESFATLGALDLLGSSSQEETIQKRKDLLELLIGRSARGFEESKSHLDLVKKEYGRIYEKTVSIEASLEYRGLFGASSSFGQAAFEVGLAFDAILNLPFLPGSSLKGAVRAAYNGRREKEIFGSENQISNVIFADSYPIGKNGDYKYFLFPDLINPHYKNDEMSETKVQPTPIIHLTVSPGLRFKFIIAFKKKEHIRETLEALAIACHRGLGARTAVGYGRFSLINVE